MANQSNRHTTYLFWGDLACFIVALYLSLVIRALGIPVWHLISLHILPFSIIFAIWLVAYYIAGLYDYRTATFESKQSVRIINMQLINSGIAILIFYFIPNFLITPKTVLFIDLIITLVLILGWRVLYLRKVSSSTRQRAQIIGTGPAVAELRRTLTENAHFGLQIVEADPQIVILDLSDPNTASLSAQLYPLLFTRVRFLDLGVVYEDVFGRVPLSLISDKWVLEHISLQPKPVYTFFKRVMDIVIALPLFIVSIVFYPFVILAIKLENRGPIFVAQERVGENRELFALHKFGSMTGNDSGNYGGGNTKLAVTRVGTFLRKSRIDELPQLLSVLKGEQSLVGPRAELPALVEEYRRLIPYYDVRHTTAPGMSGWAQVCHDNHPHHGTAVEQTKEKLSYDLFYVKNRSIWLDLKIALKTIRTLLSRAGA